MKQFLFVLLLFSFLQVKAQEPNKTINQNTDQSDSVFQGQIIVDKSNRSRIYLTGFKQTLDSNGVYTTTYIFGAKTSRPTVDVNIRMNFASPVIFNGPVGFEYGPEGVGRYSGSGGVRNNNLFLFLQGQVISSNHHFYIRIKSKKKPSPKISGVDGQANF